MNSILFLDIETTGFSTQWDSILEIAAMLVDSKTYMVLDEFHTYVNPHRTIPYKVIELTGINASTVRDAPIEEQALMDFAEWVVIAQPNFIVGHNCKNFDLRFIRERCEKYGLCFNTLNAEIIDTLSLARQLNKQGKIKTANCQQLTLAQFFGIEYSAHSALEDVKALIQIYQKLKTLSAPARRDELGF